MNRSNSRGTPFKKVVKLKALMMYIQKLISGYFCCGKDYNKGYNFWKGKLNQSESAPDSCCVVLTPGCGLNVFDGSPHTKLLHRGCMNTLDLVIQTDLSPKLHAFVTGAVILTSVQLLTSVLSFILAIEVYREETIWSNDSYYESAANENDNEEEQEHLNVNDKDAADNQENDGKAKRYRKFEGKPKRNKESSVVI